MKPIAKYRYVSQYARSSRGQRSNMRISDKRYARIGLVAAQCKDKLITPFTYGGTMNATLFEQWFKDKPLKALPKGCVIIMDNERSFVRNCERVLTDIDFSTAVFAGTQSH